jgi:hypothetical protein
MAAMSDSVPIGDLAAAVSGVLRGERTSLHDLASAARERAENRLRDRVVPSVDQQDSPALPAPVEQPMPRPGPARPTHLRLPDGRRVRVVLTPELARRRDLSAVARVSAGNDRRAFDALRRHRLAIDRLNRSQADLAGKLETLQDQADLTLAGVVQGFAGLERRARSATIQRQAIATMPLTGRTRPASQAPPAATSVRRLPQVRRLPKALDVRGLVIRTQVQSVTNVVNSAQAAAYGQRGSVFATNNLLVAGNQLFWTLLDPVLQRIGVLDAASATMVAAVAPLGALLTGEIVLADRQHVRFITGIASFDGTTTLIVESLRGNVSEQLWPTFQRRTDVPITAQVLDRAPNLQNVFARVASGAVRIQITVKDLEGDIPVVRIAWTVDTGADVD